MIENLAAAADGTILQCDVAVVGAGPAGIVTAIELASSGLGVVLLESGERHFDPDRQTLSEAAERDQRHAPVSLATRRQVGGTSSIWGGRCVPYDPVDFETREVTGRASWPVGYDEMQRYFQRACDWSLCGRVVFDANEVGGLPASIVPGLVDKEVTSSSLERWSLPTNFGHAHWDRLERLPNLRLVTNLTCTEIVCAPETRAASHLQCRTLAGADVRVVARAIVVACGGLESTRLLLSSTSPQGGRLGDGSDNLGRWYMAHVEGSVADVHFSTPPRSTVYGYERDVDGVYVRRRFAFTREFQLEHALPNVVSWLGNPELPDARHGSGPLSFVYLALTSPLGPRFAPDAQRLALTGADIPGTPYGHAEISSKPTHVLNVLAEPVATARFAIGFGARRFLARGRRAPGFFVYNKHNVYPFQYHGEHLPNRESRVMLSDEMDLLGRPKLKIALRFSDADIDGIERAHGHWDDHFRATGVGRLAYRHEDVREAIDRRMGGGFHQVGTTRMSAAPSDGVVDRNLAVHGAENVHVVSSSTFVTSGQANSTFMIVAFALRLADHLRKELHAS